MVFDYFESANNFLSNKILIRKDFGLFITGNLVSCKAIVHHVDRSISDEKLMEFSKANVKILNAKSLNR